MTTLIAAAAVFFAAMFTRRHLLSRRKDRRPGRCVTLTDLWNTGAAFALPLSRKAVTAASCAALVFAWRRRGVSKLGAGLVLGGGGANLYERLRHGRVYDYVQFPAAPGPLKRYVFNLADFAIFLGALLLLPRRKKG